MKIVFRCGLMQDIRVIVIGDSVIVGDGVGNTKGGIGVCRRGSRSRGSLPFRGGAG